MQTNIKIQNLLFPQVGVCTAEKLFFRRELNHEREISFQSDERALRFEKYGTCTFDTYFNSLSVSKWKKYTNIGGIRLALKLKGSFEVVLTNLEIINEKVFTKIVAKTIVTSQEESVFYFPYQVYEYKGTFAFELRAQEADACCYGGWYEADIEETQLMETNIAINICTFKREPFILRNLDILKKMIFDNREHELYGHLRVYISDNGDTLAERVTPDDNICVTANKNVGGAGGFTRGLMEIMKHDGEFHATHALMMDDDIIIEPEALYRTYMLLRCRKQEYADIFVGGAMLRIDDQVTQVEAGASWNEGRLIPNKCNVDLSHLENVLANEEEEYTEYNAWWYCATPMNLVNSENLPLPIFIRGDDLEFGLRNMKRLVLLNGICVWHEAFENKYSSYLQYYIIRNLLYDNSLHFPKYRVKTFLKRLYLIVGRELVYYRYKNIDLIFRGVNDFMAGTDFLKNTDGEVLHKEIMGLGYKAQPVENIANIHYHAATYHASFEQSDRGLRKLIRYLTINGYLLPAKKRKKNEVQIVSMAQCRPINFYREKRVLNYDTCTARGFVTQKSLKEAAHAMCRLLAMTVKAVFCLKKSMKQFRLQAGEVTNEKFWEEYLRIN